MSYRPKAHDRASLRESGRVPKRECHEQAFGVHRGAHECRRFCTGSGASSTWVAGGRPLLNAEAVLFFSYGPEQATRWERAVLERGSLRGISVDTVASTPEKAAEAALAEPEPRTDRLLIHFDVDTVDFTDTPLSENTGRNQGLSSNEAFRELRVLVNSERFSGLTVTELNPSHGDEHGATVRLFVEALTDALANAPTLRGNNPLK
jgi:arginase